MRSAKHAAQAPIRSCQAALRAFCTYPECPDYGWDRVREQYFGTHPAQVCFDWNTAVHAQATESVPKRRPFIRQELQAFFDRADDEVDRIATLRRKGWLPAYAGKTKLSDHRRWRKRQGAEGPVRGCIREAQTFASSRTRTSQAPSSSTSP